MRLYRTPRLLLVAALFGPSLCHAAVTLVPVAGTLDLQILSDAGFTTISTFDIRNVVLASVNQSSAVGGVIIGDNTNLGSPPPSIPNAFLNMVDLGISQAILVTFSNPRLGGSGLLLDAVLAPISATPFTDLALSTAFAGGPYVFDFTLVSQTAEQGGVLSQLVLVGAVGSDVPEPGTLALLGVGFFLVCSRQKKTIA
jgi:hypothetical protein